MSRNSLREHPARWIISTVAALSILAPIGLYTWVHYSNNAAAQQIEERLLTLHLPPDTELVDSAWAAQRLAGAGNGMQYAGGLLIRSQLQLEELEEFYAEDAGDQAVIATDDERLGRTSLLFDTDHDLDQPDLFMVVASGEPVPGSLRQIDLRGH